MNVDDMIEKMRSEELTSIIKDHENKSDYELGDAVSNLFLIHDGGDGYPDWQKDGWGKIIRKMQRLLDIGDIATINKMVDVMNEYLNKGEDDEI